jgi:hypothetical protein
MSTEKNCVIFSLNKKKFPLFFSDEYGKNASFLKQNKIKVN